MEITGNSLASVAKDSEKKEERKRYLLYLDIDVLLGVPGNFWVSSITLMETWTIWGDHWPFSCPFGREKVMAIASSEP